ncbi:MAG TPA: phosphoribosylamine--glycine ligase [Candidatus Polarisedimenticolaceae bacterium]|nr:phosphoribosylamine--glycine ligase [Candidatus Polarisedimenticolaceae bacterium]
MRVLLVGGGGREHALAWALGRSPQLDELVVAPGNAGIADDHRTVAIAADDVSALVEHATSGAYDLVVVGPEAPLVGGLADRLGEAGVAVFGPTRRAAELEASKVFAKRFMTRHRIPTADYRVFDGAAAARDYLGARGRPYPLVVKADGLAAGKGVSICADAGEAIEAAEAMLVGGRFGEAGRRIVVEELLRGREASFFVLADGRGFLELATCQDYKRAGDGDTGPNTGGMGAYSPSVHLDAEMRAQIHREIVEPTIAGLRAEERDFRGVLYVGLMLTGDGPKVLEYNARFGDPETQVMMPRLDGDWLELLHAAATGRLNGREIAWKTDPAVCVVMAAEGYPGSYAKGWPIDGIAEARAVGGVVVFHAGTARDAARRLVTAGGRVLGVTATAGDLGQARRRAYLAVEAIDWQGRHYRGDIARDAIAARTEPRREGSDD